MTSNAPPCPARTTAGSRAAFAGARVLVTDALGAPGRSATRRLARAGFAVVGIDDPMPPRLLRPRHWVGARTLNSHEPSMPTLLPRLLRSARADVLLPLTTPATRATAEYWDELMGLAAIAAPPWRAFEVAYDRHRLFEECASAGVRVPRLLTVAEAEGYLAAPRGGPAARTVVVKPRFEVGGAQGVAYCTDVPSLHDALDDCAARHGAALIQEFVPGPPTAMRSVSLVFDRDSRAMACFAVRKLEQWPATGGLSAFGFSIEGLDLATPLFPLFERIGYRGIAEVELKVGPPGTPPALIEVNPRVSGLLGFAVQCGVDLPTLAVRGALGQPAPERLPRYRVGRRYVNSTNYLRILNARRHEGASILDLIWRARTELWGATFANPLHPTDATQWWALVTRAVRELREARDQGRVRSRSRGKGS